MHTRLNLCLPRACGYTTSTASSVRYTNVTYMTNYWAKTYNGIDVNGKPAKFTGIDVITHSMAVSYCANALLKSLYPQYAPYYKVISALIALHDIGKITPMFQTKIQTWTAQYLLKQYNMRNIYHGTASYHILSHPMYMPETNSTDWFRMIGAHHGMIDEQFVLDVLCGKCKGTGKVGKSKCKECQCSSELGGYVVPSDSINFFTDDDKTHFNLNWTEDVKATINELLSKWEYSTDSFVKELESMPTHLRYFVAGLTTIADWIGSDESNFNPDPNENRTSYEIACEAIRTIGFEISDIKPNLSFNDIFGFEPNEMQVEISKSITKPGVYIIEASMGQGKTEAALYATYKLMSSRQNTGFYFAMPTQATSNRIIERIDGTSVTNNAKLKSRGFLENILVNPIKSLLVHGNSWLFDTTNKTYINGEPLSEYNGYLYRWFNTSKKSLLYPFGVGTIDQALIGVLNVKHFFIRQYALAGKVIIIDEVHTYDKYTGGLIEELIKDQEKLGCTIIILSATLTASRKNELMRLNSDDNRYPLLTSKVDGMISTTSLGSHAQKKIKVSFDTKDFCEEKAIELAKNNGVVLWVCDTVSSSQKTYLKLKKHDVKVGLLHSKFKFQDRTNNEQLWMDLLGKNGDRQGCILVATQVVEQSVDLDADLLITELAPTDMILQRLGRLWRHNRIGRPVGEPEVIILKEEEIIHKDMDRDTAFKALGKKAYVYFPYILLRTLKVLDGRDRILIPNDMRTLIEETYKEINERGGYLELKDEMVNVDWGKKIAQRMSTNKDGRNHNKDDEVHAVTRLSEQNVAIVMCDDIDNTTITFDGVPYQLDNGDKKHMGLAKAIHKNSVYVALYKFESDALADNKHLKEYIFGNFAVAKVVDGRLKFVMGKSKLEMSYNDKIGLSEM